MNVSIQNKELIIKNFFGEKKPRKAKISGDIEIKVDGDIINIMGVDIDSVLLGKKIHNISLISMKRFYYLKSYMKQLKKKEEFQKI